MVQSRQRHGGWISALHHFGAPGLFLFSIVDSSPIPTFGGSDIFTAILAARHTEPWYYYAIAATLGSLTGAWITFRTAERAGSSFWHKFGRGKAQALSRYFEKWGTGALAVVTAVPFPFPTGTFFAVVGATKYPARKYITVVGLCRAARYGVIALVAEHYGRHFTAILRHPGRYWGWLALIAALVAALVGMGVIFGRKLEAAGHAK
ncbi:MAG TPA: VTT domain-containing protein [Verrucomicrobiae bacterium]|nr:VTT domain-containing protein [Verrucomicrobiae bacterium]